MKHLKKLAVATVLVAAVLGPAATASATLVEFHAAAGTALNGGQVIENKFSITGSNVTCKSMTISGTAAAGGSSLTQKWHPTYSECTAFGLPATVTTAGCNFEGNAETTQMKITECTGGETEAKAMVITASNIFGKCVVEIPNQIGIAGVEYENMGGWPNRTLTIKLNSTNLRDYVRTSTGACPLTVGTHTNASWTGSLAEMGASGETYVE